MEKSAPDERFILESERILLTPFTLEDVNLFHKLNSDVFVKEFLWDGEIIAKSLAEQLMDRNQKHFDHDNYGLWKTTLKSSGEIVGYTGLWFFFQEPQPQLLYALLEPYTGKGLAKESAGLVIDYAFTKLNFPYLIAAMEEGHVASQKVAVSLDMDFAEKKIAEGKPTIFYRIDQKNY